jgi:hypothetical protein
MLKGTWPHDAKTFHNGNPEGRPMVSLLFSGGVFRGVFQVGVLNALSELTRTAGYCCRRVHRFDHSSDGG